MYPPPHSVPRRKRSYEDSGVGDSEAPGCNYCGCRPADHALLKRKLELEGERREEIEERLAKLTNADIHWSTKRRNANNDTLLVSQCLTRFNAEMSRFALASFCGQIESEIRKLMQTTSDKHYIQRRLHLDKAWDGEMASAWSKFKDDRPKPVYVSSKDFEKAMSCLSDLPSGDMYDNYRLWDRDLQFCNSLKWLREGLDFMSKNNYER